MNNKPLQSEVHDGLLTISIGISTLAFCQKKENGGQIDDSFEIINESDFARCVLDAMTKEDEVGNSLLTQFIDKAVELSLDLGNHGVKYPKKSKVSRQNKNL